MRTQQRCQDESARVPHPDPPQTVLGIGVYLDHQPFATPTSRTRSPTLNGGVLLRPRLAGNISLSSPVTTFKKERVRRSALGPGPYTSPSSPWTCAPSCLAISSIFRHSEGVAAQGAQEIIQN